MAIGIAAGAACLALATKSCEGERPTVTNTEQAAGTTTTEVMHLGSQDWYKEYGWDQDYAKLQAESYVSNALAGKEQARIATGRCITTDFGDTTRVIKHPLAHQGEHDGIEFTTFIGVGKLRDLQTKEDFLVINTVTVTKDGIFRGAFGVVPNQQDLLDHEANVGNTTNQRFPIPGEIDPFRDGHPIIWYDLPAIEGNVPGQIVFFAPGDDEAVNQHCTALINDIELPDSAK